MIYETNNQKETFELGYNFGKKAKSGDIFCLTGDLGTGKTIFSKGFGKALGIDDDITSPTFSILNIYDSKIPFYHFDVYRINHIIEMDDTGYEEYFFGNGISLIEWAEIIEELIPKKATWIKIEKDYYKDESYRKILITEVEN